MRSYGVAPSPSLRPPCVSPWDRATRALAQGRHAHVRRSTQAYVTATGKAADLRPTQHEGRLSSRQTCLKTSLCLHMCSCSFVFVGVCLPYVPQGQLQWGCSGWVGQGVGVTGVVCWSLGRWADATGHRDWPCVHMGQSTCNTTAGWRCVCVCTLVCFEHQDLFPCYAFRCTGTQEDMWPRLAGVRTPDGSFTTIDMGAGKSTRTALPVAWSDVVMPVVTYSDKLAQRMLVCVFYFCVCAYIRPQPTSSSRLLTRPSRHTRSSCLTS